MSVNPWIELSLTRTGLFQLAGKPTTNYNLLLYGKALLARRDGHTVFFIDNLSIIDRERLQHDLENSTELLNEFYVFTPKNLQEYYTIIDDLDLLYFQSAKKPIVFISGIFNFLLNKTTKTKSLSLMTHILGLLLDLTIPVFVTNEMRAVGEFDLPFLSFFLPTFFTEVYIVTVTGKETEMLKYNY